MQTNKKNEWSNKSKTYTKSKNRKKQTNKTHNGAPKNNIYNKSKK